MHVVIRHLQYQRRYFLRVVQTLEVTVSVNRNLFTRPVIIEGVHVPPLLRDTERLGAAGQPKIGTLNVILIVSGILITLAFGFIHD